VLESWSTPEKTLARGAGVGRFSSSVTVDWNWEGGGEVGSTVAPKTVCWGGGMVEDVMVLVSGRLNALGWPLVVSCTEECRWIAVDVSA